MDKKIVKERIGRSPDTADAVALTFADLDSRIETRAVKEQGFSRHHREEKYGYDPLANNLIGLE